MDGNTPPEVPLNTEYAEMITIEVPSDVNIDFKNGTAVAIIDGPVKDDLSEQWRNSSNIDPERVTVVFRSKNKELNLSECSKAHFVPGDLNIAPSFFSDETTLIISNAKLDGSAAGCFYADGGTFKDAYKRWKYGPGYDPMAGPDA